MSESETTNQKEKSVKIRRKTERDVTLRLTRAASSLSENDRASADQRLSQSSVLQRRCGCEGLRDKGDEVEANTLQRKTSLESSSSQLDDTSEGSFRLRRVPASISGRDFSQIPVHTEAPPGLETQLESGRQAERLGPNALALLTQSRIATQGPGVHIQRKIGDGHDLTSPRFSRLTDLEAVYDSEKVLSKGVTSSGRGVQAVQQALYDLGYLLPDFGADGKFGKRTKAAVKKFQHDAKIPENGTIDQKTIEELDKKFGAAPKLDPKMLAKPWTQADVCKILCPWSPRTIDVLATKVTVKSFDSISWADEEWDGAAWKSAPFPGGGYQDHVAKEIGVLNSNNESMAETLYHEVLHAEQPSTHKTTSAKEGYAYRIGEEFSIAMGLGGRPSLRSTDKEGREFADPTKVESFVAKAYPSVPKGGGAGEEITGKGPALGEVEVTRPNGSIYIRKAVKGEKVPGPISLVNEKTHPSAGWTCP